MKALITKALTEGYSFEAYKQLFEQLVAEGKTTGANQTEGYVSYTKLNWSRWKRAEKNDTVLAGTQESLNDVYEPLTLIILTEAWCGDASQAMPIIEKVVKASDKLRAKIILRDEHDELMSNYLTNGGKAIPKVLIVNKNNEVVSTWGPRPVELQALVVAFKKENPEATGMDISALTQRWYVANKGVAIQEELIEELLTYCCKPE